MPLSFNCPDCGKRYEQIRDEFLGKKTKCKCGRVMRLRASEETQRKVEEYQRASQARKQKKQSKLLNAFQEEIPDLSLPSAQADSAELDLSHFENLDFDALHSNSGETID